MPTHSKLRNPSPPPLPAHQPLHIVIVGAGLCGLGVAISTALSTSTHVTPPVITILESASELRELGAGLQVTPNGSRLLRRWGVHVPGESKAMPKVLDIRRWDGSQVVAYRGDYVDEMERRYGAPWWCFHRADLHDALSKRASELGVCVRLGATVSSVETNKHDGTTAVVLDCGERVHGDVVIAADGLRSAVRPHVLGSQQGPQPTGDMAYRAVLPMAALADDPELLRLASPALHMWVGPDKHIVLYGIRGGELHNMVWIAPDDLPEGEAQREADTKEVKRVYAGWDNLIMKILSRATHVDKWQLQQAPALNTWLHPTHPIALAGDACHAMLPYLAQGANVCLEDAATLGFLFGKVKNRNQIRSALVMYESLRKERIDWMLREVTAHRELFHLRDGREQEVRDRGEFAQSFQNEWWTIPKAQSQIFSYDAYAEAEKAFALKPFKTITSRL
ncbi:MAG: hypothetical protein M1839_000940 [Geoglossum umbratile]|nr:MAG: hypothetical protein M1839_000940 [Geoglossum umbratile]